MPWECQDPRKGTIQTAFSRIQWQRGPQAISLFLSTYFQHSNSMPAYAGICCVGSIQLVGNNLTQRAWLEKKSICGSAYLKNFLCWPMIKGRIVYNNSNCPDEFEDWFEILTIICLYFQFFHLNLEHLQDF